MPQLAAFVGHSFSDDDRDLVRRFLDFFDRVAAMGFGFSWDHAEPAEPKELSQKVREKMQGKNLFIGICTAKERAIDPAKLRPVVLQRDKLAAPAQEFEAKTSDWMLQEIGCACGREMNLIILLEEGLRKPGGLQGDVEYIPFSRGAADESHNKLLEMLQALSPRQPQAEIAGSPAPEVSAQEVATAIEPERPPEKPIADWTVHEFDNGLFNAVSEGNSAEETRLTQAYLASEFGGTEYQKVRWGSLAHYLHATLRGEDRIAELTALRAENPDHDSVASHLARLYEGYGEMQRAGVLWEESAAHVDDATIRLERLCSAAQAYVKAEEHASSNRVMNAAKSLALEVSTPQADTSILKASAAIASASKQPNEFQAFTEAVLELNPEEHQDRFQLAYHYSEEGDHDLAYYHYEILSLRSPALSTWNNLGVAAAKLDLPARAISAYRESQHMGGTLAMSNIAHRFIGAGFVPEAQAITSEATAKPNYHPQVGTAISRIKEVLDDETQKLEEIKAKLKKRRSFSIHFGKASLKPLGSTISGTWRTPECELALTQTGTTIEASGSFARKRSSPRLPRYAGSLQKQSDLVTVHVHYSGWLDGHSIRYSEWESEERRPASFAEPEHTGLMVVSEDGSRISVWQKGTRETELFIEFVKVV